MSKTDRTSLSHGEPPPEVAPTGSSDDAAQDAPASVAQHRADEEAAKPPPPMAHTYLTTGPSKAFGAEGVFVDLSEADARAHGALLAEATPDQIARRRGGAVSTVVS